MSPRFTSENNPRKNHPNARVKRRPADLGITAKDTRSAARKLEDLLDEPEDRIGAMAERMKYTMDTGSASGPLPYPADDEALTVEQAESNLAEVQENATERKAEVQRELARIDAAVLLARRDLDAARSRARLEEQKQQARRAPAVLAEGRRQAEAQRQEQEQQAEAEAEQYFAPLVAALAGIRKELAGMDRLMKEWLPQLRSLDELRYAQLPQGWSLKGRDVIARSRTTASKLRDALARERMGMASTIQYVERVVSSPHVPRTSEERTNVNEAKALCKAALSGHVAFLEQEIVKLFVLVNSTVAAEGGLLEDDITVAPHDAGRGRQSPGRAAIAEMKRRKPTAALNQFQPHDAEPEQTRAEDRREDF